MAKEPKKNSDGQPEPQPEETKKAEQESPEEAAGPEPEKEDLSAQLEQAQQEKQALQEKYMRLAAEYDNFRKRSQKERESLFTEAKNDALCAMLPVYDNVERALRQPCQDEAYAEGVKMIMRQLEETFQKLGVTEIEAEGVPFDPNKHNAVMHVEDESLGESTVAEVFQKGFMIGEKVVRFAMVKVAN